MRSRERRDVRTWTRSHRGPALLIAACCLALAAAVAGAAVPAVVAAADGPYVLDVPYVSQADGTPYEAVNCGPASVAMVLRALGVGISVPEARAALSRARGVPGDYRGAALETLATVLAGESLRPVGLLPGGRLTRWSPEAMREELYDGHPVIAEVRERLLPGHDAAGAGAEHYIVLVGVDGEDVLYHDPALPAPGEAPRKIPVVTLFAAMAANSRPFAAVAIAPSEGRYPVRLAAPAPPAATQAAPADAPPPAVQPAAAPLPAAAPAPPAAVVQSGRWWEHVPLAALALILLALLLALAIAYAVYASSGPVGTLVFFGGGGEQLGQLALNGWRHTVRWNADACSRHLPAVDVAALRVDRGPDVAGRTTIRLGLVTGDGHVVSRILQHWESCPLGGTGSPSVTYLAAPAGSRAASAFGALPGWQPRVAG
jgi:hypothetical protein